MSQRIRSVLFLFLYLALVYNLEKLGMQVGVNLTLYPLLYMVVTAAVLVIIATVGLFKVSLIGNVAVWSGIYLLGRWILYPTAPFWMGMNIYQTVTEVVLLAIAVALAHSLANQLHHIDELGKALTLPASVHQVRNFTNAVEDMKVEFIRSRRYNHPLSLMIIEPAQFNLKQDLEKIVRENQKKLSRRLLATELAEIIVRQTRRTDMIVTKNWDGRFIVLCPENSTDGTSALAQRIQADVKSNLDIPIHYGIAAFPADALTLEELLRHAESNMANGLISYISGQSTNKASSPTGPVAGEGKEAIPYRASSLEKMPESPADDQPDQG